MYSLVLSFAILAFGYFVSAAPITTVNSTLVTRYDHCNRAGVFALTFDDGPSQYSYDLAKSLHQQGIKATFFINGNNTVDILHNKTPTNTSDGMKTYLEVVKYYYDAGHELASHTYEHINLAGKTEAEVRRQMNAQSDVIFAATGRRPQLMRPPEGALDDNASRILKELGYSNVMWDVDPKDWELKGLATEQSIVQTIMDADTPSTLGHIGLLHDIHPTTVNTLVPWITQYVRQKGLQFVTVSDCIGVAAYQATV
ncbi:chitin deacetylase [Mucor ambiguus]|uniref:Chitin deacetylase n=1 Tax=Mucor ambiguus TaxID=91626 RepID=A0A0C9N4E5_9FUNG|nr:chitin deacetylase [Mucor ambiguus]